MDKLDTFDRKLLQILQRDSALTSDQLAPQVGLSASAVQRRIKRLRSERVITSVVSVVDPGKIGRPTFFVVGLEVERERPELLTRLRAWLNAEDSVQQVYYVTGSHDFILIVTAVDLESYDELMSHLMADNPNVRRFTTNVALGVHKRRLLIPTI